MVYDGFDSLLEALFRGTHGHHQGLRGGALALRSAAPAVAQSKPFKKWMNRLVTYESMVKGLWHSNSVFIDQLKQDTEYFISLVERDVGSRVASDGDAAGGFLHLKEYDDNEFDSSMNTDLATELELETDIS